MTLPNTEKAYERLAVQLKEIDTVKVPSSAPWCRSVSHLFFRTSRKISARSAGNWSFPRFSLRKRDCSSRGWI